MSTTLNHEDTKDTKNFRIFVIFVPSWLPFDVVAFPS